MQISNGNFAFGADITGLQTLLPFNTLSSWGWHNSSLPHHTRSNFPGGLYGPGLVDAWAIGELRSAEPRGGGNFAVVDRESAEGESGEGGVCLF